MSPQEHDVMRSVEDHYWWYQALRTHVADSLDPPAGAFNLLDAGCGTGGMLDVLRKIIPNARLTGIELSARALELASARETGAELVQGSVSELPFPEETFDRVLSIDVLTHAAVDETRALREAHRVLRPAGKLIINVAAFEFLKGAHDVAVDVDRRYTRGQLTNLLKAANFSIERATYWNALFTPPIALLRWLSRSRSRNETAQSDFRSLPPFVNATLRRIALLELSLSRHLSLPFGTSLFAVARKNG